MAKSSIDIAESLARRSASTIFELRGEWRRLHRAPPPMRLSRDLLMRAITYKLQERPLGGLLQIDHPQAGTPEPQLGGRRAKARTADFVRHAACPRMARRHPYRACPCRRVRMERPALSVTHNCRLVIISDWVTVFFGLGKSTGRSVKPGGADVGSLIARRLA